MKTNRAIGDQFSEIVRKHLFAQHGQFRQWRAEKAFVELLIKRRARIHILAQRTECLVLVAFQPFAAPVLASAQSADVHRLASRAASSIIFIIVR